MIVFQAVTKRFSDDQPAAVDDVSFAIDSGELVVITGRSGSGKTTLMRLLTKEYQPSEGDIIFEDQPLSEISMGSVHHHRRRIGVIFQDYKLLPEMNIWENIALPLYIINKPEEEIEQRVTDLLRLVELEERAFHFPSQLSGGEAQRVSIARALATGPSVIFADEPTGNLDNETTKTIAKLLQKIHQLGTTVLLTTHDVGVLSMLEGERVLTLDKGKLIKDTKAGKAQKIKVKEAAAPAETPSPPPATNEKKEPAEAEEKSQVEKPQPAEPMKTTRWQLPKITLPFGKKADQAPNTPSKPSTDTEEDVDVKVETL